MKKYIVEHEFDGYEIGTYLKETKGMKSFVSWETSIVEWN